MTTPKVWSFFWMPSAAFICLGEVNSPGIKVLGQRPKTLARRKSAAPLYGAPAMDTEGVVIFLDAFGSLYLPGRSEFARHQGFGQKAQNAWHGAKVPPNILI